MTTLARRAVSRTTIAAIVGLVGAGAIAGCTSPYGSSTAPAAPATTTTIAGASTPAQTKSATLRGNLTYLMVEHAYLLGRAAGEQARGNTPTPSTTTSSTTTAAPASTTTTVAAPVLIAKDDAAAALEANSHEIADLMSTGYGAAFGPAFYPLWSSRIQAMVAYTAAKAAGDSSATATASAAITSTSTALATLIHATNKYLEIHTVTNPATGIGDELTADNQVFQTLLDALAANDSTQYAKVAAAARAMVHTADMLASAAAKLGPDLFPGTPTGTAANLRASLTALIVDHAELASVTYGGMASGQSVGPVLAVLSSNADELHNAVASIYDDATAARFTTLWKTLGDVFAAYSTAPSGQRQPEAAAIDAAAGDVATFIASSTGGKLTADTIVPLLKNEVAALEKVIDGAGTSASDEATRIRAVAAAGAAAPGWAPAVAEAVCEQFPTRYLP